MPTNTYQLMRQAILARQPVVCRYKGQTREICPHVLGTSGKREMVLAWQYAGGTNNPKGLPPGGEWRCMIVDDISLATIKPGPWRAGRDHRWDQTCVEKVDVDAMKQP
jgi:hypothetical protein